MMTPTQQKKMSTIINKLLIMTKDGKCEWLQRSNTKHSYVLTFDDGAKILMYQDMDVDEMKSYIHFDVYNQHNVDVISLKYEPTLKNSNMAKLFDHVKTHYDQAVAKVLDNLLEDLNNLTKGVEEPAISECLKKNKSFWKRLKIIKIFHND